MFRLFAQEVISTREFTRGTTRGTRVPYTTKKAFSVLFLFSSEELFRMLSTQSNDKMIKPLQQQQRLKKKSHVCTY